MNEIKRSAHVHWAGDLRSGRGQIMTPSKALDGVIYSFASRFEKGTGTDPEELIAAAHAACFSMMLSKIISDEKKSIDEINTTATVVLRMEGGPRISEIHLKTEAKVAGMSDVEFAAAAEKAKENCPVSQLLKPGLEKLSLESKLV